MSKEAMDKEVENQEEGMSKEVEQGTEEQLLAMDEAAAVLGISRSTFSRLLAQGRIRGQKVGRQWRFRRSELDKFGKMAHPSAADIDVDAVTQAADQLSQGLSEDQQVVLSLETEGYPATEEEVAIQRLFAALLSSAVVARASDLHIDAARDVTHIRRRIDGVLHEVLSLPLSTHKALLACAKLHAGMAVDQTQIPQDGRFRATLGGREFDARMSTVPAIYGEAAVIRFLEQGWQIPTLDKLGMRDEDMETFRRMLRQPAGLILLTGPTGHGKTMTIYTGLAEIASPEHKILTAEDPVESVLPWVTQVQVRPRAGLTFPVALRSFLRQDPDILMASEIRDLETAEIAFQGSLTGHLVMTSLHAGSAPLAIQRLFDMGIEPFLVAEGVICIVAERLVRLVCTNCMQPDPVTLDVAGDFIKRGRAGGYELPDKPDFVRGAGCDQCRRTGYRGRTALFEVMEITPDLRSLVANRASVDEIRAVAVANGMTTLEADGLRKAAEGITTITEVMRVMPNK